MSEYLEFREMYDNDKPLFQIIDNQKEICLGYVVRRRVGRFMHWVLEPTTDTFFSNGCLKEISEFITKLYSREDFADNYDKASLEVEE